MDQSTKRDYHNIEGRFAPREPNASDTERLATISKAAAVFAKAIADNAPENSDETRHAIKGVQEAALWAKEAIRIWQPARMVENGLLSGGDAARLG